MTKIEPVEMPEHPQTYEEAKRIVQEGVDNEVAQRRRRSERIRMMVYTVLWIVLAVALGNLMGDYPAGFGSAAFVYFFAMFAEAVPHLHMLYRRKQVLDGSYFESRSEEEVMKMATDYVDAYNRYLASRAKQGTRAK